MERVYLNIPYAEKEYAKSLGQIYWDADNKKWFCMEGEEYKFEKYLPLSSMTYKDLSDEQKHSIDMAKEGNNILVDACIGSGKTTTIQVMCNEMPDKKILYLTYNRLLKEDAQMKIISPNTQATNYDGFAYTCLKKNNLPVDLERNIILFNKYEPETPYYDVLILDEYQDIREDIADMLKLLKERNPSLQIIAVGDMEQKIYNTTTLDIKKFIKDFLSNYEQLSFTNCYRLNKEHAEHLGFLWDKKINGVNDKQENIYVDNLRQVVDFLKDKEPKDILVLGSRNGDASIVLNMLETKYPDRFNKNTVYASIRDEDRNVNVNRNSSAIFTTYDSSKGLERKYCICLDWTTEYWITRSNYPDVNYNVLKNLFLVAGSRGKSVNMFINNPTMSRHALTDSLILTPFEEKHEYEPFQASTMYDFIYKEDLEKCFSLLKVKPVNEKNDVLTITNKDGNIDLSPCIGTFIEANFFKNYDLDQKKNYLLISKDFIKDYRRKISENEYQRISYGNPTATCEEKILMLTATETNQDRYAWQVEVPFVKDMEKKAIMERLSKYFNPEDTVQQALEVDFIGNDGNEYEIHGICDVIKDNTVWELKFEDDLQQTNYLQLGFYLCAMPKGYKGMLYNVKTDEIVEVEVPDKKKFLKETVRAISKRNLRAKEFYNYKVGETKFNYNEIRLNIDNGRSGIPTRAKRELIRFFDEIDANHPEELEYDENTIFDMYNEEGRADELPDNISHIHIQSRLRDEIIEEEKEDWMATYL